MSYAITDPVSDWWALGPKHVFSETENLGNPWLLLWEEQRRVQPRIEAIRLNPTSSFAGDIRLPFESTYTLPGIRTIPDSLTTIEQALGVTVKELAQLLRVSRPMIYHWRSGMEPSPENRARIEAIARLAEDWKQQDSNPVGQRLHFKQTEGISLIDLLSCEILDLPAIRIIMKRLVGIQGTSQRELESRKALLRSIVEGETPEARLDVIQERQLLGKPSYIGDTRHPGKLIEIQPDATRRSGRMVNRKFVPDGEE